MFVSLSMSVFLSKFPPFVRALVTLECGFPGNTSGFQVTHLPVQEMQETRVRSLGQEDLLEKEMATVSSILAWRIPWTEEPGGL